MSTISTSKAKPLPSSNWLNLQKQLKARKRASGGDHERANLQDGPSRKRRKLEAQPHVSKKTDVSRLSITSDVTVASSSSKTLESSPTHVEARAATKNGESLPKLQQMILGQLEYTDAQKVPGKYLAIDCEMVGLGINGSESSLARVSIVNFHGAAVLDVFVRQKERVVDYRTQWSGIRPKDMINAKPFEEVQKAVADLIKDKILIGHAIHNDLKALLLSHPRQQIRDTQSYAHKFGVCKSKYVALRNLVKDEIGVVIQSGEHSSLTDARATMAVYRVHKKEWEKASRHLPTPTPSKEESSTILAAPTTSTIPRKRGQESDSELEGAEPAAKSSQHVVAKGKAKEKGGSKDQYPGGGRKSVSSGLSTIVHRKGEKSSKLGVAMAGQKAKSDWWKQLPGRGPVTTASFLLPPITIESRKVLLKEKLRGQERVLRAATTRVETRVQKVEQVGANP